MAFRETANPALFTLKIIIWARGTFKSTATLTGDKPVLSW